MNTKLIAAALAACAPLAFAQSPAPNEPPAVIQIAREAIKEGKGAAHRKVEADYTNTFRKNKYPFHYLALSPESGPNEVLFGLARKAAVMDPAHIHSAGGHLPVLPHDFFEEPGIALRDDGVHGGRGAQPEPLQHSHDAVDADAVAIIAVGIGPEIGISTVERAQGAKRLRRLIEREELDRNRDPESDPGAVRPGELRPRAHWAMDEPVVVEAATALRIGEGVGR